MPCSFIFELPDDQASLIPVASCIVIKYSNNGEAVIRAYTPVSGPDLKGELHFIIKKYENGNASKYLHGLKVLNMFLLYE